MDDDEDEFVGGLYENGHWVWDDNMQALVFVSDLPSVKVEAIQITSKAPTGAIEFREDIDLIEQLRFKRRYQRKADPLQEEWVTLQDVKDIAIYTAPVSILSPMLIDMLHLPTTERFLRALIFCCAYYLQVADLMTLRTLERDKKIRTNTCEILENEFRSNLCDLRVLVAKEYCVMLIGGADMKKFHHMGSNKKRQSLSDKDARLFETFAHMSVRIVYLALGRKNYRQIELECHRIFKTDIFNTVEHTYKTGYLARMTPEERKVLRGTCLMHEQKLNTHSPLMNEVFCQRPIDYRMMGLGVVKYKKSSHDKSAVKSRSSGKFKGTIGTSFESVTEKSSQTIRMTYPEIILPPKDSDLTLPSDFPEVPEDVLYVSQVQRRKWQNRLIRLNKVTA